MVKVLLLVLCLGIGGCTALQTAMSLAQPATNGINAELTVGDKTEEIVTEVGRTDNNQKADTIENHIDNIPMTVLVLLILGWVLPSPNEIWRGFKDFIFMFRK